MSINIVGDQPVHLGVVSKIAGNRLAGIKCGGTQEGAGHTNVAVNATQLDVTGNGAEGEVDFDRAGIFTTGGAFLLKVRVSDNRGDGIRCRTKALGEKWEGELVNLRYGAVQVLNNGGFGIFSGEDVAPNIEVDQLPYVGVVSRISGNGRAGIWAGGEKGDATVTDAKVDATQLEVTGNGARAIDAVERAGIRAREGGGDIGGGVVIVERNAHAGIEASEDVLLNFAAPGVSNYPDERSSVSANGTAGIRTKGDLGATLVDVSRNGSAAQSGDDEEGNGIYAEGEVRLTSVTATDNGRHGTVTVTNADNQSAALPRGFRVAERSTFPAGVNTVAFPSQSTFPLAARAPPRGRGN